MTSMGGRKLLDARRKKIGIEISVLLEQVDELRAEAADIDTATTVLDRYAIRLPALQQKHDAAFGPVTHAIVDMPDDADAVCANMAPKWADNGAEAEEEVPLPRFVKPRDIHRRAPGKKPATSEERKHGTKEAESETPTVKPVFQRKAGLQPVRIEPADKAAAKALAKGRKDGIHNTDTSGKEPPPAWRGKPGQQPDITSIDLGGFPVSLAGFYLMINGQPSVRLDKWQKAVLGELMKGYPEQTLRIQVKGMVKDIDAVIGQLRGFPGLAPLEIITTNGGWKLKEVQKEA